MKNIALDQAILSSPPKANGFVARFFVRGDHQPFLIADCADMRVVISKAMDAVPNFSVRNPWILRDSLLSVAWIFVDPETETQQGADQESQSLCNKVF
jgi:hypothetical protein